MTFWLLLENKLIIKEIDLKIVKAKLIIVATNPLIYYIFSKILCLYLYIRLI